LGIIILGVVCRRCRRPFRRNNVIAVSSYVPPQPTSPIIHTTTTSSYNSVPPVPAYNGPIYNQNNMYSNPNQGGMTSSVPAQNYNNNQGVPSPADYNPAAQQSNDYNHH